MAPIRILILEDDEDIIDLIKSILDQDYEFLTVANGREGLQLVDEGEPDLVICDVMMPVMDGWEFIRMLRMKHGYEHIPVIFLTALSAQEQIRKGYELGGALYLTKPINPTRLKRNIELYVSDHSLESRPKRKRIDQVGKPKPEAPPPAMATPPPPRPAQPPRSVPVAPPPPKPAPAAAAPRPCGERVRIMIVDDDKDLCQMLTAGLGDEFDVLESYDGMAAIECAVRQKPDIFVIDGKLPRMTGYQLTSVLKKHRDFYKSPIVFMSGKATSRDQEYARSLGITHFLAKPITAVQVRDTILGIIGRPDFIVHTDRPVLKSAAPQNFTHLEAHRKTTETPTLSEIEHQALTQRLKQQLS